MKYEPNFEIARCRCTFSVTGCPKIDIICLDRHDCIIC
jgi:hypothetical protein